MGGGGGKVNIKDSEDQKELARIAREKWTLYQDEYVDLENQWMGKITKGNDAGEYAKAGGIGNLSTNSAYGRAMDQLISDGGNPSRINANINHIAESSHQDRVGNVARMQVGQQDRYIAGLQNIANVGQGKEASALDSMHDAADISARSARESARTNFSDQQSRGELVGFGIGAASRYTLGLTDDRY